MILKAALALLLISPAGINSPTALTSDIDMVEFPTIGTFDKPNHEQEQSLKAIAHLVRQSKESHNLAKNASNLHPGGADDFTVSTQSYDLTLTFSEESIESILIVQTDVWDEDDLVIPVGSSNIDFSSYFEENGVMEPPNPTIGNISPMSLTDSCRSERNIGGGQAWKRVNDCRIYYSQLSGTYTIQTYVDYSYKMGGGKIHSLSGSTTSYAAGPCTTQESIPRPTNVGTSPAMARVVGNCNVAKFGPSVYKTVSISVMNTRNLKVTVV